MDEIVKYMNFEKKKKTAFLFDNKVFCSEQDLAEYLAENIDKYFDEYTKENIEQEIANKIIDEAEEIEIIGFKEEKDGKRN